MLYRAICIVSIVLLSACGGGGGGGNTPAAPAPATPAPANPATPPAPSSPSPDTSQLAAITTESLPKFVGAHLETLLFTTEFLATLVNPFATPQFDNTLNQTTTEACAGGGNTDTQVTGGGANVQLDFVQCILDDGEQANGSLTVTTTAANAQGTYRQTVVFDSLVIQSEGTTESLDGQVTVDINQAGSPAGFIQLTVDAVLVGSEQVEINNLVYRLPIATPLLISQVSNVSGELTLVGEGSVQFSSENPIDGSFLATTRVTGSTPAFGRLNASANLELIRMDFFSNDGDSNADAGLEIPYDDFSAERIDFFSGADTAPVWNGRARSFTLEVNQLLQLDVSQDYFDADGDILTYTIELSGPQDGIASLVRNDLSYANVQLTFPEPGDYIVTVIANDGDNSTFPANVAFIRVADRRDTDGDGTENESDNDDDNDGIPDSDDAFPLDANEQSDNDGDGIGDVADTDDDNDQVNDDADSFPFNSRCALPSDGDGDVCYLDIIIDQGLRAQLVDKDGVIFFWADFNLQDIYRYSTTISQYLPRLVRNDGVLVSPEITYWPDANSLILLSPGGEMNTFDLTAPNPTEVLSAPAAPGANHMVDVYGARAILHYRGTPGYVFEQYGTDYTLLSTDTDGDAGASLATQGCLATTAPAYFLDPATLTIQPCGAAQKLFRFASFSPDGRFAFDRNNVYDTATGDLLQEKPVFELFGSSVTWSGDRNFTVANRVNDVLIVWNVITDELVEVELDGRANNVLFNGVRFYRSGLLTVDGVEQLVVETYDTLDDVISGVGTN